MKKMIVMIFVLMYVFSITGYVQAEEDGAWPPFVKLGRGVANVVTSPLEITKNIGDANKADGAFAALTWGLIQGLADTVGRISIGAYEIVTFPIPIPGHYAPILTDPEYFLQEKTY